MHIQKWIYTAVTRATDFKKKVYFYNGKSEEMNETLLDSYLSKKIRGYMQQDKQAKRLISKDNYITKEWLKRCLGTNCQCGVTCTYLLQQGKH